MTAKEMQREAAEYLSLYRSAMREAEDIERRIERLRSETGVKGINYENGDMPRAQLRTGDLSDYAAKIDGVVRDWNAARIRAAEIMRGVSAVIAKVEHTQARRVLMLHFIDGESYEAVQRIIPCGRGTVFRLRRHGLIAAYEIISKNKSRDSMEL